MSEDGESHVEQILKLFEVSVSFWFNKIDLTFVRSVFRLTPPDEIFTFSF